MARGAQAMASMGQFKFPQRSGWHDRVISQALAFPAGAYDDAVDVMGLAPRITPLVGRPTKQIVIRPSQVVSYDHDEEMGL